jgi:hypothetical protein
MSIPAMGFDQMIKIARCCQIASAAAGPQGISGMISGSTKVAAQLMKNLPAGGEQADRQAGQENQLSGQVLRSL